jgi:hypothetical protein
MLAARQERGAEGRSHHAVHLLKHLYLDQLAVAGGGGTDVMRRIKTG